MLAAEAEAAEREQEERDLEAQLAQASRGDGQACLKTFIFTKRGYKKYLSLLRGTALFQTRSL